MHHYVQLPQNTFFSRSISVCSVGALIQGRCSLTLLKGPPHCSHLPLWAVKRYLPARVEAVKALFDILIPLLQKWHWWWRGRKWIWVCHMLQLKISNLLQSTCWSQCYTGPVKRSKIWHDNVHGPLQSQAKFSGRCSMVDIRYLERGFF